MLDGRRKRGEFLPTFARHGALYRRSVVDACRRRGAAVVSLMVLQNLYFLSKAQSAHGS